MSSRTVWKQCGGAIIATFATTLVPGATIEQLEARANECLMTVDGRSYDEVANRAFWRDASFMGECAPPGGAVADPITIYVEILSDGRMGQFEIVPKTAVARCILERASAREFPKPPMPYVLKIEVRFTK